MNQPVSQERYVNFYTDFAFKKLFGTEVNKELLISFLNSLFDGEEVVKDLTYLNAEHTGKNATERKAVFDVFCENEKGEKFLIEKINKHTSFIAENVEAMVEKRKVVNKIENVRELAIAYHDEIAPYFDAIRYHIDKLELIVEDEMWTLPKYRELLFIR